MGSSESVSHTSASQISSHFSHSAKNKNHDCGYSEARLWPKNSLWRRQCLGVEYEQGLRLTLLGNCWVHLRGSLLRLYITRVCSHVLMLHSDILKKEKWKVYCRLVSAPQKRRTLYCVCRIIVNQWAVMLIFMLSWPQEPTVTCRSKIKSSTYYDCHYCSHFLSHRSTKTHPGPVVHLSDSPKDEGKVGKQGKDKPATPPGSPQAPIPLFPLLYL